MRVIRAVIAGVLIGLPVVGFAAVVHAQGVRPGASVLVPQGTVVNKTLFAFGPTIDVAGTVNGDIVCAGQNINVTGTVNGDVLCAGQNVHVSGMVHGNVRVAGQNVTLDGLASRNMSAAGQVVTLESAGKAGGDASFAGQNVTLNGSVGRDAAIASNDATIGGTVTRDIVAKDAWLTLGPTARVGGDIAYTSRNELVKMPGARVAGTTTRSEPTYQSGRMHIGAFIGGGIGFAAYLFIALLSVSLLLVVLFPQLFQAATSAAIQSPLKTVLVGFAAFVLAPVFMFAMVFTVFGIPLAILACMVWMVVLALAGPLAAYYVGRLILGGRGTNAVYVMLVGALVLLVLYFIPIVGLVVTLLAVWFGTGMIVLQIPRLPKPRYAVAPEKPRK